MIHSFFKIVIFAMHAKYSGSVTNGLMALAYQNMESFSTLPSCEVFWSVYRWSIKILSLRSGHPNFGSSQLIVGDPPRFFVLAVYCPRCYRHPLRMSIFCGLSRLPVLLTPSSDFLSDSTFLVRLFVGSDSFGPTFCRIRLFWSDFLSDPTFLVRLFVGSDFPLVCTITERRRYR